MTTLALFDDLPDAVRTTLVMLVDAAKANFQDELVSIVLFGSGAEGRLQAASDINLMVVLRQFHQERADGFREPMRMAHVAVKAVAMFITEPELPVAVGLFPVKFADIARRHRVLFGELPPALKAIDPAAQKRQLQEMLMNLALRLRYNYIIRGLRDEQIAAIIAHAAGPLRTAAATLLALEGKPASSPKAALEIVAGTLDGGPWAETLANISQAHETEDLPAGTPASTLFQIMAMTEAMRRRIGELT
ncbi:MAG: nucleotidyltransferase domain-containing protein [Azoarcus sp.]|nr:nucleotidyltransferase domain-containing protein [Azoarcus sp.]